MPVRLKDFIATSTRTVCVVIASSALLLLPVSVRAQDRPSVECLYQQWNAHDGSANDPFSVIDKNGFLKGAKEAIQAMENKQPIKTSFFGMPSLPPPYIDEEFGVPMDSLGCMPAPVESGEIAGRRAALLWYADHGRYPINSNKPQHPLDKIPKSAKWSSFSANSMSTPIVGLPGVQLELARVGTVECLNVKAPSKKEQCVSCWSWPAPASLMSWTLDKDTGTIWVSVPAHAYVPLTIQSQDPVESKFGSIFNQIHWLTPQQKALSWSPLTSHDNPFQAHYLSVFMKVDHKNKSKQIPMLKYRVKGHIYEERYDGRIPWQKCKWTFDANSRLFYLDVSENHELTREYVQIDPKSGKKIQCRDSADYPV